MVGTGASQEWQGRQNYATPEKTITWHSLLEFINQEYLGLTTECDVYRKTTDFQSTSANKFPSSAYLITKRVQEEAVVRCGISWSASFNLNSTSWIIQHCCSSEKRYRVYIQNIFQMSISGKIANLFSLAILHSDTSHFLVKGTAQTP